MRAKACRLRQDIGRFKHLVNVLGTSKDNVAVRVLASSLREDILQSLREVNKQLADCKKQKFEAEDEMQFQKSLLSHIIDIESFQRSLCLYIEKQLPSSLQTTLSSSSQEHGSTLRQSLVSHAKLHQRIQRRIEALQNESKSDGDGNSETVLQLQLVLQELVELQGLRQQLTVVGRLKEKGKGPKVDWFCWVLGFPFGIAICLVFGVCCVGLSPAWIIAKCVSKRKGASDVNGVNRDSSCHWRRPRRRPLDSEDPSTSLLG